MAENTNQPLNCVMVQLPVVDRIHSQSNQFSVGVKMKVTAVSKCTDSPDIDIMKSCTEGLCIIYVLYKI